jgi:hypothetical protein
MQQQQPGYTPDRSLGRAVCAMHAFILMSCHRNTQADKPMQQMHAHSALPAASLDGLLHAYTHYWLPHPCTPALMYVHAVVARD